MEIKISIALVTRNRPESLKCTLNSIVQQNEQPYEIVLSDDSNEETCIIQNKLLAKQFGCKYFSGPQRGLYANRNFAAINCTGTHIRTMDDDHEFPENHFLECLKAVRSEPDVIWTIGEYTPSVMKHTLPSPVAGQLHPRGYSFTPKDMNEYYGISCGGSIYPRKVIEDKIFNCEYYMFGIIYLEYGARLKRYGFQIKSLRTTYLIHNDQQSTASLLTRQLINEARIFSMLCLSFFHFPTLLNKINTLYEIIKEIITAKISPLLLFNAYTNFKKYRKSIK